MRVVHLSTSDLGGAATAAINLHLALLAQGVDSDLLSLTRNREDIPRHTVIRPFELSGVPWINRLKYKFRRVLETLSLVEDRNNQPGNRHLQGRPHDLEIFSLPYSWFSVLDHPLVQQADVVHLHWVSYGLVDHRDFFSRCRSRIVWTMHDMYPITGGCHHADACTGYMRSCEVCPQLRDLDQALPWWRYKKDALDRVPEDRLQLVAPSQWLAERAAASTLMKDRPCAVIPNGFDTTVFRFMDRQECRSELGLPAEGRILLFNALDVWNPRKGFDLLLKALVSLPKDVMLVCLGRDDGLVVEDRTVFRAGAVQSREKVARYFAAADLFVLPSLAENLPNTVSESLLCGTPVVAFRVGGIPEQLDATNGILVDPGDTEALGSALITALDKQWDHARIADAARERYDSDRVASSYRTLYGTADA